MTAGELVGFGWQFHQIGDFATAEQYYRQAVDAGPDHADAWCYLGLVCRAQGKWDDAVGAYRQALRLRPGFVEAHNNLGNVLVSQGRLEEAVVCFRDAIRLNPNLAQAHNNLGAGLRQLGRFEEAIGCYRQALRLNPAYPEAHNNLGEALLAQNRPEEAVAPCREALRLHPGSAQAHNTLGSALRQLGKFDDAIAHYRQALQLQPNYGEAHSNLGIAFYQQRKLDAAIASYRQALSSKPELPQAHYNLGVALAEQGRLDDAVPAYQEAVRLKPNYAEAVGNLGHALRAQGKLDEALACYQRAVELSPDDPAAHMSRAFAWLLLGDYEKGFAEYEWRWRAREFGSPPFAAPPWDGLPLAGRTILLHAEQGLGDTLQFVRYAKLVQARGGRVVLLCQKPLKRLLVATPGVDQIVAQGETIPDFSAHAPLLSLPRIFGTTLQTTPADVPYVFPEPALVERWSKVVAEVPGFKIGIAWQGNPDFRGDRFRSFPVKHLAAVAALPGVRLISLQKGPGTEQLHTLPEPFPVVDLGSGLDEESGPFMDTAAVMMQLDLIISMNSAIVHLAGALGARTWLALDAASDWRWLLGREDSPWYPSLRLFRQERLGDWDGVFRRMAGALEEELAGKASPRSRQGI
jgi:tetratricopeptide (TPR) repeat protein